MPIASASVCIAAQPSSGVDVADGDLLDLGVDRLGRNLLPGRDRRRRLGVGQLVAERGEQLVIGERRVVPGGLHRREVVDRLEPLDLDLGRDRYSTKAQPAVLLSLSLKTLMLPPPTNDVPASSVGWWATVQVAGSAPASVTMPIIHGPLMNEPISPFAKPASSAPSAPGRGGGQSLLEERVVVRQRLDARRRSRA